jgi:metal-responsive CopG/Arc/MetJ family transcriptional regulator
MRMMTLSLKDEEQRALERICEARQISSRHRAIKIAITEYIERFNRMDKHHRVPDFKLVECPENK